MRHVVAAASLLATVLCASTLRGQEPGPPTYPAPRMPPALSIVASDTAVGAPAGVASFERPNGALLRAGSATFDMATSRDGQTASLGVRTVTVLESNLMGNAAWLLVESRTGSAVETVDSLWMSRGDLSPQRWVAASGRARIAASWVRDTMFGALQSYQGRSSFTANVGAGVLVTPGMVERVVELLPLAAGYHVQASLLLVEMGTPRAVPAELSVEREESLPRGDRTVDCWVVALRAGATEQRLWVTKETPRVVRTEQAFATGLVTASLRP